MLTDCADVEGTCLGDSGDIWASGSWDFDLTAGTTYYLVLDGWFSGDDGAYDVTFSKVAPPVPFSDVAPIYQQKCAPCHTVFPLGGHQIGAADTTTGYTTSQQTSYTAPPETKGFATLVRIQNGSMPQGAGCTGDPALDTANSACLTQAEQDLIQAWITGGQLPPL